MATATVSVTAVNNPPAVAANGGSLSYSENGAAAAIDTALTVSDVDSANLVGATVSIANFHAGEDVLGFTAPNWHHRQLQCHRRADVERYGQLLPTTRRRCAR